MHGGPIPEAEPPVLTEAGVGPERVRRDLDLVVGDNLPLFGFGLGLLFALICAGHVLFTPAAFATPLAVAAGVSAALLATLGVTTRLRRVAFRLAHPLAFGVLVLVLANNLLTLALSGSIHQTVRVLLTMMGLAFLVTRTAWFGLGVTVVTVGWAAVALSLPWTDQLPRYAFGVVAAAALSGLLHAVRRTSLRRLEISALAASAREEEMRNVFALSRELQCLLEPDGRIRRTNPAMAITTGVPMPELVGRAFADLLEPDDRPAVRSHLRRLADALEHVSFESRLTTPQGPPRWIVWDAVSLDSRGAIHAAGRDVTVSRRMEVQLRLFQAALESAASGIVITDRTGVITWVNPAFTRLTGFSAEEIEGRTPSALKSGRTDPAVYQDLWTTILSGLVWRGELQNRRKDASLYTEELIIAPVRDGSGDITHFVAVKNDITERRTAEQILRRNADLMQRELSLAVEVQSGLRPRKLPSLEGFEVAAEARPARFVSGDLYDWVELGPETCLFAMADISGKGVSAAMLASSTRSLLRALATTTDQPGELLAALNRVLYAELDGTEMFVTVFVLRLDSRRGVVTWANAGHTRALVARDGELAETLPATGLPVGTLPDLVAEQRALTLVPGDALLVYSDGVTEAQSPAGAFYGRERLEDLFLSVAGTGARAIIESVDSDVRAFQEGGEVTDDVTLLAIRALRR